MPVGHSRGLTIYCGRVRKTLQDQKGVFRSKRAKEPRIRGDKW